MRTIKTGIAIFLVLLVSQILDINNPLFAGIATLITMQSSVSGSWEAGKNRMLGTVLGAVIGLIFSTLAPNNPFVIGIGVVIIIYLCNLLDWKKAITISSIVFMAIMLNQDEGSRLNYSIFRTLDTFLGIIVGMIVNYFISPPDIEENMKSSFYQIIQESNIFIDGLIWEDQDIELEEIKNELAILEKNYYRLKEEFELKICTDERYAIFKNLFIIFEKLYIHLELMTILEDTSFINEENKKLLEKKYNKRVPIEKEITDEKKHAVFNYHLKNSLTQLEKLESILLEK